MRRLFSTFAGGWPGVGLLLMRLVAAIAFISHGISRFPGELQIELARHVLAIGAGILLLAGLWTPFAGALAVVLEVWHAFSLHPPALHRDDPWVHILLGTLGAALALVGPGKWSVDSRLYGWKRITIRDGRG